MTEREKMLAGQQYNSRDPELIGMYHQCKRLLAEYDRTPSDDGDRRFELLQELLGFAGEGIWIERTLSCDYGKNIYIGKNTFINYNCVFVDDNLIKIGENVLIGPAVQIYTATHPLTAQQRLMVREDGSMGYLTYTKPVTIGDNVWIGGGAIICPGVTIGNNAVIGAGSVVTKDIGDDCIAYGNPCKVSRKQDA